MEQSRMPKTFWEKPEGKTGMVFLGLLGIGGAFLLYTFLPFIIALLQNTITALGLLAVVGAIVYVALDPKFRTLLSYGYKMVMRHLTGMFIQLDPIAIIEGYVEDLKKNKEKMNQHITDLRSQLSILKREMDKNSQNIETNLKYASAAKQNGKQDQVILQTRKAGRLKESNTNLNELYVKMEKLYRVLAKMYETAGILLEDIQDEVEVKKRERKAITAGHSAFKSAMSIISGDPDKQALFNQTMEFIAEDLGMKIGEMERFMEISAGVLDSVDIENGIAKDEGFKLLEQWEKEGTSTLLGSSEKQLLLTHAEDPNEILDLDKPIEVNRNKNTNNKYMSL